MFSHVYVTFLRCVNKSVLMIITLRIRTQDAFADKYV